MDNFRPAGCGRLWIKLSTSISHPCEKLTTGKNMSMTCVFDKPLWISQHEVESYPQPSLFTLCDFSSAHIVTRYVDNLSKNVRHPEGGNPQDEVACADFEGGKVKFSACRYRADRQKWV